MKKLAHIFAMLALLFAMPAMADDTARAEERAALLQALKSAPDETVAFAAADAIWELWLTAPDEKAQAMLDAALERRGNYDFAGAIEHLDDLIDYAPDYAEGWNQRATMLFLQEKYGRSLDDIIETLEREPAHFGALAGRAVILMRQGRTALGQKALREAIAIHPYLRERSMLIVVPKKKDPI